MNPFARERTAVVDNLCKIVPLSSCINARELHTGAIRDTFIRNEEVKCNSFLLRLGQIVFDKMGNTSSCIIKDDKTIREVDNYRPNFRS